MSEVSEAALGLALYSSGEITGFVLGLNHSSASDLPIWPQVIGIPLSQFPCLEISRLD